MPIIYVPDQLRIDFWQFNFKYQILSLKLCDNVYRWGL